MLNPTACTGQRSTLCLPRPLRCSSTRCIAQRAAARGPLFPPNLLRTYRCRRRRRRRRYVVVVVVVVGRLDDYRSICRRAYSICSIHQHDLDCSHIQNNTILQINATLQNDTTQLFVDPIVTEMAWMKCCKSVGICTFNSHTGASPKSMPAVFSNA